jgi:hypothetical protein
LAAAKRHFEKLAQLAPGDQAVKRLLADVDRRIEESGRPAAAEVDVRIPDSRERMAGSGSAGFSNADNDEVEMMVRAETAVKRPVQHAKQRITSLTLPRVEPPGRTA